MVPGARTLLVTHCVFIVFIFRATSLSLARLTWSWKQSSSINFRTARMTVRNLHPPPASKNIYCVPEYSQKPQMMTAGNKPQEGPGSKQYMLGPLRWLKR